MDRRLIYAYDRMMMPDGCAERIIRAMQPKQPDNSQTQARRLRRAQEGAREDKRLKRCS